MAVPGGRPHGRRAPACVGFTGLVRDYYGENPNIVVELNVLPGPSSVDGKLGWFGEFGKCCVSNV